MSKIIVTDYSSDQLYSRSHGETVHVIVLPGGDFVVIRGANSLDEALEAWGGEAYEPCDEHSDLYAYEHGLRVSPLISLRPVGGAG